MQIKTSFEINEKKRKEKERRDFSLKMHFK